MPRTAEHRVLAHQIATERLNAGKPVWASSISFANVFPEGCESMPEEPNDDQARSLGKQYAKMLRANRLVKKALEQSDWELEDILDAMECLTSDENGSALDDLNEQLDALYDWADIHRLWVEVR